MAFGTKIVRIGDEEYEISRPDAVTGARTAFRLAKILAPGLGSLANAGDGNALFEGIWKILEGVDENTFMELLTKTVNGCRIKQNGHWEQIVFEHHFSTNLFDAFALAKEALAFQYADFFTQKSLLSGAGAAKAPFRPAPSNG